MTVTVPIPTWKQFFRAYIESSFAAAAPSQSWNIAGTNGWRDQVVVPGAVRFTPNAGIMFPQNAAGKRALNRQPPIEGGQGAEGSLEMPVIPETIGVWLYAAMGGVTHTPTAGSAALTGTDVSTSAWDSQALDTDPDDSVGERLKFTLASSTASTDFAIIIEQPENNTVETITVGTSASSIDGDYYSKYYYTGTVYISTSGSVSSGGTATMAVAGQDSVSSVFTMADTNPSVGIQESGQPRGDAAGGNALLYKGCVVPSITLNYDRTALDGLLMATTTANGQYPTNATEVAYDDDPATYPALFKPFQGWTASLTKGGSAFDKVQVVTLTIGGGTELFPVSSGNQNPSGKTYGPQEITLALTLLPEDKTEWDALNAQTVGDYHLTFTSPYSASAAASYSLLFEFTKSYIETYEESVAGNLFSATLNLRTIEDSSDDVLKATLVSKMPL